jgi:hypothetical protein
MATFFFFSSEYQSFNRDDTGFVSDLYSTFFNRPADGGGLTFWTGLLAQGMPREVVLVSFMFSTEFQTFTQAIFGNVQARKEVDTVVDFYRGLLSRLPDDGGLASWVGQFRAAQCAGAGSVYSTVEAISSSFANGGEYASRNRTNAQYVGDLYNAFLRRGGDLAGVQFWISQLVGGATRSAIRQQFIASPEFTNRVNAVIARGVLHAAARDDPGRAPRRHRLQCLPRLERRVFRPIGAAFVTEWAGLSPGAQTIPSCPKPVAMRCRSGVSDECSRRPRSAFCAFPAGLRGFPALAFAAALVGVARAGRSCGAGAHHTTTNRSCAGRRMPAGWPGIPRRPGCATPGRTRRKLFSMAAQFIDSASTVLNWSVPDFPTDPTRRSSAGPGWRRARLLAGQITQGMPRGSCSPSSLLPEFDTTSPRARHDGRAAGRHHGHDFHRGYLFRLPDDGGLYWMWNRAAQCGRRRLASRAESFRSSSRRRVHRRSRSNADFVADLYCPSSVAAGTSRACSTGSAS